MFKQTALTSIDSYKLSHADQYPAGTTKVYSNFTPRANVYFSGRNILGNKIVWFGLQGFLKELVEIWHTTFFNQDIDTVATEYAALVAPFCGPNGFNDSRIRELHSLGYLPLEIRALPEGSLVNIGIPVLTITNTDPRFYWLPNFLETWLSAELWKSSTSASTSAAYRKLMERYYAASGANTEFISWAGHDFSVRGMSGIADAAKSGAGHLLSFTGTDNIPAVKYLMDCYSGNETFVGGSVPATEHSVSSTNILSVDDTSVDTVFSEILSKLDEKPHMDFQEKRKLVGEYLFIKDMITSKYLSGIISLVSDTFDFWKTITIIASALREEILARTPDQLGLAKVVFRPDSGDPIKILTGYDVVGKFETADDFYARFDGRGAVLNQYSAVKIGKKYYAASEVDPSRVGYGPELSEAEVKGAVECLAEVFGTTVNSAGYKTLNPCVGLIYGDSITLERAEAIMQRLIAKGYAADNIVFGIGSYTFQYTTRDSLGFAMKATYVEINGVGRAIFKDPKTDSGTKRSARGLLRVRSVNGEFVLDNDVSSAEESGSDNCLTPVFRDGKFLKTETLQMIRDRLKAQ